MKKKYIKLAEIQIYTSPDLIQSFIFVDHVTKFIISNSHYLHSCIDSFQYPLMLALTYVHCG